MLEKYCIPNVIEAGCDEAGRGPLAGSVFAAAVVWSRDVIEDEANREWLEMLDDSKKLTDKQRHYLRPLIEQYAQAWAVVEVKAAPSTVVCVSIRCGRLTNKHSEIWDKKITRSMTPNIVGI